MTKNLRHLRYACHFRRHFLKMKNLTNILRILGKHENLTYSIVGEQSVCIGRCLFVRYGRVRERLRAS